MEKRNGREAKVMFFDAVENPPEQSGVYMYIDITAYSGKISNVTNVSYSMKYKKWNCRDDGTDENAFPEVEGFKAFWADLSEIQKTLKK